MDGEEKDGVYSAREMIEEEMYEASAAILAGGSSSRMGSPKALLPVDGRPLVSFVAGRLAELFAEVFAVGGGDEIAGATGLRMVRDREPGMGPLMGIASALEAARFDLVFVAACDMPEIDAGLVGRLHRAAAEPGPDGEPWDCVVPRIGDGRFEPLFAFYRKSALPAIEETLGRGVRSVRSVFPRLHTRFVDAPMPEGIVNLNTPEDYARWAARSRKR